MMVGSFLKKLVPELCVPMANLGGTASPASAPLMDVQVTTLAQSILTYAQFFNTSAKAPLQASTTFDTSDSASVLTIITAAMTNAGCAPNLMKVLPQLLQSATAVAKAVAKVATEAASQSNALSHLPIQMVLGQARLVYSVQYNVLPFFTQDFDVGQYATYLGPMISDPSVLAGWQKAASISTAAALKAMGVTGGDAAATTVRASAYGAGVLQACSLVYYGLLTMTPATVTSGSTTGSFTVPNVLTGLVSISSHLVNAATRLQRNFSNT
jgi:hypothetical protein